MFDEKKWSIACIKFKAYYGNVPPWIKTAEVAYYHELVSALEEASGEDLSHFKIPAERVRRRDWMASIPLHGMKVQSDSQRKLSQIA